MDDNPNSYRLPKRINDPVLLWMFPLTHVMPGFFCMGASILMGHVLFFAALSVGWYFLMDYIDTRYHRGYLLHRLYWSGLTSWIIKETKTVPDGMKREYMQ